MRTVSRAIDEPQVRLTSVSYPWGINHPQIHFIHNSKMQFSLTLTLLNQRGYCKLGTSDSWVIQYRLGVNQQRGSFSTGGHLVQGSFSTGGQLVLVRGVIHPYGTYIILNFCYNNKNKYQFRNSLIFPRPNLVHKFLTSQIMSG